MVTTTPAEILNNQMDYDGVNVWHANGITGKGITVWDVENTTSTHGKSTRNRVLTAAPGATVISKSPTIKMGINNNTKKYEVKETKVTYENKTYSIEEFVKTFNIKIITSSLENYFGNYTNQTTPGIFWKELAEKYDILLFQSSGNDGKNQDNMSTAVGYRIAAASIMNGKATYKTYSNRGDGLDFTDFTGASVGTSFSTPYIAGKAAMVWERYPKFNGNQVIEYLKKCCEDMLDEGYDIRTGWGIPILPDDFDKSKPDSDKNIIDIDNEGEKIMAGTTEVLVYEKGSNTGKKVSLKRVLYNNENYIRLRDFEDILEICDIDYDETKKLPIIRKTK